VLIALLETSDPNVPGSMRRYADLVEHAIGRQEGFRTERISLTESCSSRSKLPQSVRTLAHHVRVARNARRLRSRSDIDLFHVMDGSHGYIASNLPRGRAVVTVHDVIPWLQSQRRFAVAPPSRPARWIIDRAIHGLGNANRLFCDSTATQSDLQRANRSAAMRSSVIFPPLEPTFFQETTTGTRPNDCDAFILHLGNNAFYKNRRGALEVFRRIAATVPHHLLMAGPPPIQELKDLVVEYGIQNRVRFIENPSDAEVMAFYRAASLFLFPSQYEGFGWPPLEAMACGCPVVCSDAGSLDEVVGNAALKADPNDLESLAQHCLSVLGDASVAKSLRNRGIAHAAQFSVNAFGEQLIREYRRAASVDGSNASVNQTC
jgi:glycosyltransferase involved in cell wall biosynthesis